MGKTNVLLINKADFLSEEQRKTWTSYFDAENLQHAFYSASAAAVALASRKESISEEDENASSDEEESGEDEGDTEEKENISNAPNGDVLVDPSGAKPILTREELVGFLKSFKKEGADLLTVGLVGYPNVGKSSTINSLMASKKTSVSSTPGKTKHFQVLF
jgi:large subunit GTPase 1